MNAHQIAVMRSLLKNFEDAVRADETKGGGDPNDVPAKEAFYRDAKRNLYEAVGIKVK